MFAGPFSEEEFESLVPSDKKLAAEWVASLYRRGTPEVYRGAELNYIGMPIGGICCGQLYLGGDGRLWNWDIFKSNYSREQDHNQRLAAMTLGGDYKEPRDPGNDRALPVTQGFAVRLRTPAGEEVRTLDARGFANVTFRGEYPVARVSYGDDRFPLEAELEAFSPFIPLNPEDSSIPATVLGYKLRNTGADVVDVEIAGWLENAVCHYTRDRSPGRRRNRVVGRHGLAACVCTAESELETSGANSTETPRSLEDLHGYGSMALCLLRPDNPVLSTPKLTDQFGAADVFSALERIDGQTATQSLERPLVGALGSQARLAPGEQLSFTFLLSWYFPHFNEKEQSTGQLLQVADIDTGQRHYSARFASAADVAEYVAGNWDRLSGETLLWNRTWYDSTLPYWFLDRTFASLDCLATHTCVWFDSGRFWGWEGVDCCPGTCTHVWQYAQGLARIFPQIERDLRERVDFGLALQEDGVIGHRAEHSSLPATDGQAGTILRAYREHQMSPDGAFLARIWPGVRRAIEYLMREDRDGSGLIEAEQPNTLDAAWYGPMGWISSLYLASLAAGQEMAREVGDREFEARCAEILAEGRRNLVAELFNGEYFIHKPDPAYPAAINSNTGCHIDQVFGESYARQLGLPRVVAESECRSALRSLWKYNFAPDAGAYREKHRQIKGARIYVMPGEAGLIMCTWPQGGVEKAVPGMEDRVEDSVYWQGPGGYFDECMTGFEYQVASHMIWEGLTEEGLAITRAIHDRYHPFKRNPYNEIECSNHYARAMASYGAYLAACGFEHHGPERHLGFAPRLNAEDFRAAFTTAQGWGTFHQTRHARGHTASIDLKWGRLWLRSLALEVDQRLRSTNVRVAVGGNDLSVSVQRDGTAVRIRLLDDVQIAAGESMTVEIGPEAAAYWSPAAA